MALLLSGFISAVAVAWWRRRRVGGGAVLSWTAPQPAPRYVRARSVAPTGPVLPAIERAEQGIAPGPVAPPALSLAAPPAPAAHPLPTPRAPHAALRAAWEAFVHHDYLTVLDECAPYLDAQDLCLRAEALHLTATACVRLNQFAAALPHWRTLLALDEQAQYWLGLATTAARAQQFGLAQQAFGWYLAAYQRETTGGHTGPQRVQGEHFASYLLALTRAGRPDLAMAPLETLAACYRRGHRTDAAHLVRCQLPEFAVFLRHALRIVRAVKPEPERRRWFAALYEAVDAEGRLTMDACAVPSAPQPWG